VVKMAGVGAPIKFVNPKEGLPLTSGPMNIMVLDKAPHPNATKVFVNWLLTDEGGRLASQGSGYPSERVAVSNKASIRSPCRAQKTCFPAKNTNWHRMT